MTAIRLVRKQREAFTLLEVMLAVAILGLLMTTVYATWSAALIGWKRSASVSESFQRERIVMDTLSELTSSLVYFGSQNGLYDVQGTHNGSEGDTVSFVTSSDVFLPPDEASIAGMRRVTIGIFQDQGGNPFLGIINEPALQPKETSYRNQIRVLSYNVCGLQIQYRDPRDASFKDQWNESIVIPEAIVYSVAFCTTDQTGPPVTVTRAVDIPIALYAMQAKGVWVNNQSTTNEIEQSMNPADLPSSLQPASGGSEGPPAPLEQ